MSSNTFTILFVCSGNSCRSPIAEGLMRAKLLPDLRELVQVKSAGTLGLFGNPATNFAIEVAGNYGADIFGHRSQGLTDELVKEADIMFAMAPEHKTFLQGHYPEFRENVFLLKSFGRQPGEIDSERIEDPIGRNLAVYKKCAEILNDELNRILPRLTKLIEEKVGS